MAAGEKNAAAVALGQLGGAKGGQARAAALSPEARSAIACNAARKRWGHTHLVPVPPSGRVRLSADALGWLLRVTEVWLERMAKEYPGRRPSIEKAVREARKALGRP